MRGSAQRALWAATLCGASLWGAIPYREDVFTTVNSSIWTSNGTVSGGASGLTSSGVGSVISSEAQALYEVVANLGLTSCGGTYTLYLRATSNALHGPSPQGSYYAAHLALDGTGSPATGCSATLTVVSRVNNTLYSWTSVPLGVRNQSEMRALVRPNGYLSVMVDQRHCYYGVPSPALASGQPGVGVAQTPAGNGIARARLYVLDLVGPPTVGTANVAPSTASNRVDLHWRGVEEPATGIGVWRYDIYRNNAYLTSLRNPNLTDSAVAADTNYTYWIVALDYHMNSSGLTALSVHTPAAGSFDPRRTGVKPLGAYWGAGGENIDMNSGNLNYTVPLLKAVGRGSTAVVINLSYNSQQWRKDVVGGTASVWKLGEDVGYGFGWKLQMGSLRPMYSDFWTISWYLYTDSTGAEYRLLPAGGGLYTSNEGIYVTYDSATGKLWANDGSFWQFNSTSWGNEDDAGTKYPTLVQDSNGNQIKLGYQTGSGAGWANSSARISWIDDPRGRVEGSGRSYSFSYNSDATPHLTAISAAFSGGEQYSFSYDANVALTPPWTPTQPPNENFGSTTTLAQVNNTALSLQNAFLYTSACELSRVTLPYGGYIRWEYDAFSYANNKTYREVTNRYLSAAGTESRHWLYWDGSDSGRQIHIYRGVVDMTTQDASRSAKFWWFNTDATSAYAGLLSSYQARNYPGMTVFHQKDYAWQSSSSGNPYIADVLDVLNPQQTYEARKHTTQTLDGYGNLTGQALYAYGVPGTAARTYNNTYWANGGAYLRNRLYSSSVTAGGTTASIVQNSYDDYSNEATPTGLTAMPESESARLHDASYGTSYTTRGNLSWTMSRQDSATRVYFAYNTGGVVTAAQKDSGFKVTSNYTAATNYMAPTTVMPNDNTHLATSMSYTATLGLTQQTGPNGASVSIGYDAASRPATSTAPNGAVTTYTYSTTAPQVVATVGGRWTKTYLDGLGRIEKVEQGAGTGNPVSIVETQYAPCACSPMGKVKRVSRPHGSGETAVWTEYAFDALGRTTQVTLPTGAGTTTYLYEGATVRVTDPVGKWKKYTQDAFGNLILVEEPDPAGGNNPDLTTAYTYNAFDKLTNVSMTRNGVPQTRTFMYNYQQRLIQTWQPETGYTNYEWGTNGKLVRKTDGKGPEDYFYDAYERLTRRLAWSGGLSTDYTYDVDPQGDPDSNTWGRLAVVTQSDGVTERFRYNSPGQIVSRSQTLGTSYVIPATVNFGYDYYGRLIRVIYPLQGADPAGGRFTLDYSYNATGRLEKVSVAGVPSLEIINGAQYNAAGQLTSVTRPAQVNFGTSPPTLSGMLAETFSYNALGQLTEQEWAQPGMNVHLEYEYVAPQSSNDGRLHLRRDVVSGEEVTYLYDQLGRLTSAATTGPEWGLSWIYDGFGNRLQQNVTKGSGLSVQMTVDAATNRLSGTGYAYDANGNLTNWPTALGGVTASYDARNRLSTLTAPNGTESYQYSSGNLRLFKHVGGTTLTSSKQYVYGLGGELLGEYSTCQVTATTYMLCQGSIRVYFAGRLVLKSSSAAQLSALTPDRLGTPTGGGRTYPYGDKQTAMTQDGESYTTYTRDVVAGLDYAQQRYYSSTWGRFLTPDPLHEQRRTVNNPSRPASWNVYQYALNDPLNMQDPTGTMARGPYYSCPEDTDRWLGCEWVDPDPYPGGGPGSTVTLCGVEVPTDPDRHAAVAVVMGENSWVYIGGKSYQPGDVFGSPSGPPITEALVRIESEIMVSVLITRAQLPGYGGTSVAAVARAPGQFLGYSVGLGLINSARNSIEGSTLCNRLRLAVEEVENVFNDPSAYAFGYTSWKAQVDGDNNVRPLRSFEFWVARTAFHR